METRKAQNKEAERCGAQSKFIKNRSTGPVLRVRVWQNGMRLWRGADLQVRRSRTSFGTCCFGAKHRSKSKYTKHTVLFGPCLGVQWKNWSFLWCERTGSDHFRKSGCGNSAAVVAGNAFPSQNVRKHGFRPTFGGINFGKCEATRRICSNQNVKTIRFAGRFLKHEVRLIQTHCILYSVPKTFAIDKYGCMTCLQSHVPKFGDTDTTHNVPVQNLPNPDMHQHEYYFGFRHRFVSCNEYSMKYGCVTCETFFSPSCLPLCTTKKITFDIVVAARTPYMRHIEHWEKSWPFWVFLPSNTGDI